MSASVMIFIAACLLMLLCLNIWLRVRVYKVYNRLARAKIDFTPKQMMNKELLKTEVIPHYPNHEKDILLMSKAVQMTMYLASIMLVFILFLGWYLMRNR